MTFGTQVRHEPDTGIRERRGGSATGLPGSHPVSFEAFYRAEHAWVLRYFRRKVERDEAPDLTQEAFMRFFGSGKFATLEYPRAYLAKIARNLWLNRIRRQKRSGILYPLDEECDAPTPPEQERRIEAIDLRRAYRPVLLAMPARTRRIFLMHRLLGMTYAQIAEQLGLSTKTIEKHMGRALKRCRKIAVRW